MGRDFKFWIFYSAEIMILTVVMLMIAAEQATHQHSRFGWHRIRSRIRLQLISLMRTDLTIMWIIIIIITIIITVIRARPQLRACASWLVHGEFTRGCWALLVIGDTWEMERTTMTISMTMAMMITVTMIMRTRRRKSTVISSEWIWGRSGEVTGWKNSLSASPGHRSPRKYHPHDDEDHTICNNICFQIINIFECPILGLPWTCKEKICSTFSFQRPRLDFNPGRFQMIIVKVMLKYTWYNICMMTMMLMVMIWSSGRGERIRVKD